MMHDRLNSSHLFGLIGWLADRLFLVCYMRGFLIRRNAVLNHLEEGEAWKRYL